MYISWHSGNLIQISLNPVVLYFGLLLNPSYIYFSVPVSASNGDGSVHKAVHLLLEFLLKETYGQQKDTTSASDKVLSSLLEEHDLSLTGVKEVCEWLKWYEKLIFVCILNSWTQSQLSVLRT